MVSLICHMAKPIATEWHRISWLSKFDKGLNVRTNERTNGDTRPSKISSSYVRIAHEFEPDFVHGVSAHA